MFSQLYVLVLSHMLQGFHSAFNRHFFEAQRNAQKYHKLFLVSQERYDKLVNLASSGGGSSIKVWKMFTLKSQ